MRCSLHFVRSERRRNARLKPRETLLELRHLGLEGGFVGGRIETRDVVQHGRAKLDPAAMLGAHQWIDRMQRFCLRLFEIFQNDRGFEDRAIADDQHRRLAERRDF